MPFRLATTDRVLMALLVPLAAAAALLHVHEVRRSGLAQLPVFAVPGPGPDAYPVVGGYRMETSRAHTPLRPGDRLLRIADRDLRGVGHIGFDAIGLAAAGARGSARLAYERDGRRHVTSLPAVPHPYPWARIPNLLLLPICLLVLLRAPGSPDARRFFVAFLVYTAVQAQFYGGPEWKSRLSLVLWNAGTPLAVVLMLGWARLFPEEVTAERRVWAGWPWLAGGLYLGVRINFLTGEPLSPRHVQPLSHSLHAGFMLATIALLARNFLYATPVGRRKLKWVLYGATLGSAPLVFTQLGGFLAPDWGGFPQAFALSTLATVAWLLCLVVAVVRYNAFDIDRLIGATATYSVAAAAGVGVLLVGVPLLADRGAALLGTGVHGPRVLAALLAAALAVGLGRRLRPQVDRLFFPERRALREGMDQLLQLLATCRRREEVGRRMAEGACELLRPRGFAFYLRRGDRLVRRAHDELLSLPAELDLDRDPAAQVAERLDALEWKPGRKIGAVVSGVALVVPLRTGETLTGILCLGPKRSGDVYSTTDRSHLARLSEGASAALQRLRLDASLRKERRRTRALQARKAEANRQVWAKTRLLATASHDIRQPLHALGLLAESLVAAPDAPEARTLAERIRRSTLDLSAMLDAVLDLSRLEAGAARPAVADVPLAPLFDQLEDEFAPEARRKALRLRVVRTGVWVRSDRVLLLRILRNLVANAVRYTDRGGVVLGVRRLGPNAALEVVDSGPGIRATERGAVFQEFRRLGPTQDRAGPGFGLGLSIVKQLAALLGHEVVLHSRPGRGARFAVVMPRAAARGSGSKRSAAPLPLSGDALRGRRVWVVEDEASVREATASLLRSWGCEVGVAPDADQIFRHLLQGDALPDFVLADHHLGGNETGHEVIERLRRRLGREIPAALLTAETDPACLQSLRATGLPVLQKPLAPARLRALLTAVRPPPRSAGTGRRV